MHSIQVDGQLSPRKVAMVTRQFSKFGGLELYTHKLVEGLLAHHYRVTVVCEKSDSPLTDENLEVITFAAPPASLSKSARIDYYLRVSSAKVKEAGPFDVVHSQHFPLYGADVVTFHNHSIFRVSECGFAWENLLNSFKSAIVPAYLKRSCLDQMLMNEAKVCLFPSSICRDDFLAHYGAKTGVSQRCLVAYPGFSGEDSGVELVDESKRHSQSDFVFLFVGRGFRKKGLDVLFAAAKTLAKTRHNFKLRIAGMSAKSWRQAYLKLFRLDRVVEYLGFRKDMDKVYAQAHAIVLPSRLEPFGMAVLQSMAHGLVPIVSESCGVAELLTHEKDALIVKDQLSADEFSVAMARLLDDRKLFESLSRQAIFTAREQCWEKTVSVTSQAYDLVFSSKQESARKESIR